MDEQEKKVVLVIEDDPTLLALLARGLRAAGFTVLTAKDGDSGLALALSEHPSLIFLDIMLPGKSGLEMLEALRQQVHGEKIPVIVLTNFDDEVFREKAKSLNTMAYLVKANVDPSSIVATAKNLFAGKANPEAPTQPVA